jgi:hypothetical protein
MSKLDSLLGKSKTYKIGEIELELKPRTLEDIDLVIDLGEPDKRAKAMKELIRRTLKEAVSDATEEEINGVAMKHFEGLSNAILDVNGLKKE